MFKLNKNNRNTTKVNIVNDVPYLTFKALSAYPWLINGFSTKLGGVSKNEFYSMNLGLARGDKEENVIKNFELISGAIGFDAHNIVTGHQTHTTNIRIATSDDKGKGIYTERNYSDIDGLITNEKGIVLTTFYADCVPLFIVDVNKKVIGLCHSGWKGTVNKIGAKALDIMKDEFGSNLDDIVVCIGPSICVDCYEIGMDVAEEFIKAFPEHTSEILTEKPNDKFQLDLWKCNKIIFEEYGINPNNIHLPDICTCCNLDSMFSHRGHQGKRGNLAAFLSIR